MRSFPAWELVGAQARQEPESRPAKFYHKQGGSLSKLQHWTDDSRQRLSGFFEHCRGYRSIQEQCVGSGDDGLEKKMYYGEELPIQTQE